MGYDWRTLFFPLAAGMNQEADPRALEAPQLAVCKNAEFIEVGGLQTRKPYASIGTNILGGGTISNIRRIASYEDELLAFTEDTLYSWSVADSAWVNKGTHLAAKVSEHPVFVDPSEQVLTDKCEVGNYALYTWVKRASTGDTVYVAAIDKTTGNVILQPTTVDSGSTKATTRPRLVPLAANALLFYLDTLNALRVIDLNMTTLAADCATNGVLIANSTLAYDACRDSTGTSAFVAAAIGASYTVAVISSTAGITTTASKARTASGSIAVATSPGTTRILVARAVSAGAPPYGSVKGDVLNANTLGDSTVNVALGDTGGAGPNQPIKQITAAYRSAQVGGQWTCYVFWTEDEVDSAGATSHATRTNTIDDTGVAGTAATLLSWISLASRAFNYNGRVYFWGIFAHSNASMSGSSKFRAQLQNSYFLYRDDGFLVAKAARTVASGFSQATGFLPGVHLTGGSSTFSWCGGVRRLITVSKKQTNYAARAPQDIEVTFDSDEARRCVQFGRTLYIAGGEILQYDGRKLVEVGWHIFPWFTLAFDSGAAGNLGAGTYTYGATFCHDNAQGERDRSAMVSTDDATLTASKKATIQVTGGLGATHRTDGWIEMWRTLANPPAEAPMRLVTSNDPSVTSVGDNGYFPNIDGRYSESDNLADSDLLLREEFDQEGSTLEHLSPPAATIVAATQFRLFLAGIAGNPYQVWYSREREDGEVATFHDNLTIDVPPTGGAITGLGFLDGTLIVFCEHAIWSLPGDGLDNTGNGQNYGPARLISSDIGAVSHDSIALTPRGLVFQSTKGIYLLGESLTPMRAPADFTDTISSALVMESKHQVRFTFVNDGGCLVWDYRVNEWSEWTSSTEIGNALHAAIWNGTHHYASSSAVLAEQATWGTAVTYALDVETAWIPVGVPGIKMGQGKVLFAQLLGEVISACDVRVQVARNYASDANGPIFFHSKFWPVTPVTVGGPLQVRHAPSIRPMEAVKFRITAYASGSTTNPPTGGAIKLTGLALQVGLEKALWKLLPSAQKQ